MTVIEILDKLHFVHPSRDGWTARCPAHPDRSPSLSIRQGERGILLYCHAGCQIDDIAEALGIRVAQLFSQPDARPVEDVRAREAWHAGKEYLSPNFARAWRDEEVTVLCVSEEAVDAGIARALALTVEAERVVAVLKPKKGGRS